MPRNRAHARRSAQRFSSSDHKSVAGPGALRLLRGLRAV